MQVQAARIATSRALPAASAAPVRFDHRPNAAAALLYRLGLYHDPADPDAARVTEPA